MPLLSASKVEVPDLADDMPPPTATNVVSNIEPWIIRVVRIVLSDIRYENSIYGPIDAYLNSIFPAHRRFQVKPQPIIRRVVDSDSEYEGEDDVHDEQNEEEQYDEEDYGDGEKNEKQQHNEDAGNLSMTSIGTYGGGHKSRNVAGKEPGILIPDFVVSKVLNPGGHQRIERALVAIEIKRDRETYLDAQQKMMKYMQRLADQPSRSENLRGWLIMGQTVIRYKINTKGVIDNSKPFNVLENDKMTTELARISVENWNLN